MNLTSERVRQRNYANDAKSSSDVINHIVSFYNSICLNSTLGYLSPNVFEQKPAATPPVAVSENC